MIVKLAGVQLRTGKGIELEDYFDTLIEKGEVRQEISGQERIVVFDRSRDCVIGMVVTIRDQRRFAQMVEKQNGEFTIDAGQVAKGTHLIDFNFIALYEETGAGLYQHYRGSCSPLRLQGYLQSVYRMLRLQRRSEWIDAQTHLSETKAQKLANKEFAGKLALIPIVQTKDLEQLMNELDEVRYFDFAMPTSQRSTFAPLAPHVERERFRLTLTKKARTQKAARKDILQFIEDEDPLNPRIRGMRDDVETTLLVENNPTHYGEYNFDDVIPHRIRPATFTTAPILTKMLDVIHDKANAYVFRA